VQVVVQRMASALEHVHRCGVIHRDVKPENILLARPDDPSSCMLSDFDMAILNETASKAGRRIVGTAGYCAPEILLQNPFSYKVDTFSLGVVMYVSLVGDAPFPLAWNAKAKQLITTGQVSFDRCWEVYFFVLSLYSIRPPLTDVSFSRRIPSLRKRKDAFKKCSVRIQRQGQACPPF
jgi:serine/threonine protein kinase